MKPGLVARSDYRRLGLSREEWWKQACYAESRVLARRVMNDMGKTKRQLVEELSVLRRRLAELDPRWAAGEREPAVIPPQGAERPDPADRASGLSEDADILRQQAARAETGAALAPAEILCICPAVVAPSIERACGELGHRCTWVTEAAAMKGMRGRFDLGLLAIKRDTAFFCPAVLGDLVAGCQDGLEIARGLLLADMGDIRGHQHAYVHRCSGYCDIGNADGGLSALAVDRVRRVITETLALPPYEMVDFFDEVTDAALHSIVESSQAPLLVVDREWKVWFANLAAHAVFRRPSHLIRGVPLAELLACREGLASLQEVVRASLKAGGGETECRMRVRDGEEFDALLRYNPVYQSGLEGVVSLTFDDITRRKRAEAELVRAHRMLEERVRLQGDELSRASEQLGLRSQEQRKTQRELDWERNLLHTLVNSLPDGIYAKDLDSRFMLVNQAVVRKLGAASAAAVIGKTDADFFPAAEARVHREEELQLLKTGAAMVDREVMNCKPGRAPWWTLITKVPLRDEQTGQTIGLVGVHRDITLRKQVEQRTHQMVNSLPMALFSFDADTNLASAVRGDVQKLLGHREDCFFSDPNMSDKLLHPDDLPAVREAFRVGLASMRPFDLEFRIVHGESRAVRHLHQYVVPTGDAQGRLLYHDSVVLDVTLERESQERLRLLSRVVEQTSEGVAVAGLDGNLLFLNGAWAAMHGGKVDDFLGTHLSLFHAPEHMSEVNQANRKVVEMGEFEGDIWHMRKDGSIFLSRMYSTLLRDKSGAPAGLIGMMRDITAWKEMQSTSARLAEAVKNAGEGIAIWDKDWSLIYANAAMLSILGWERAEDLAARKPFEYMSGESEADPVDLRTALRHKGVWRGRMFGRRGDGSAVPLAATFSRLRQEDGTSLYVGNIRDMSREEAQLAQIRRLGREAAALLDQERARISKELHDELGQELTAMNLGLAWVGARLARAEGPVRERLGEVQDLQKRMTQTVRGLAKSLRPALFDYHALGDALQSLAAEYSHVGGITCRLKAAPADIDVENPLKTVIYRIAQEALTNVIRHSGATRCRVEISQKRQSVQLRVCDNGSGSDPGRLEGTESLGIIGMKERAAAIGGELRVENLSAGGVCVTAVFPRPQPRDAGG